MNVLPAFRRRELLRRLWKEEIAPRRAQLALILILTSVSALLMALYPLVIKRAIDMFAAHDPRILYQIPLLIVLLTFLKASSQFAQSVALQSLSLKIVRSLQQKSLLHLLWMDFSTFSKISPATWTARLSNEPASIRESIGRGVNALGDVITIIGLMLSMLWMDWELSLLAVVLYPLASIPIGRLGKYVKKSAASMQGHMAESASVLTESFSLAQEVRLFSLEKYEEKRLGAALDQLQKILLKITLQKASLDPILEVIGGLIIGLVLGFAGWRAAHGGATLGDFTAFIAALFAASRPLRSLGSLNSALAEGSAGLERLYQLTDLPVSITSKGGVLPDAEGQYGFRICNVSYQHGMECNGLKNLDFCLPGGKMTGIIGPSGCGKSTFLSLLPRLRAPDSGEILLDGKPLSAIDLKALREKIGYVRQDTPLFDMSIRENLLVGAPAASRSGVKKICTLLGMDFLQTLPLGLESRVGPGGAFLSGGERQRVALARALLRDPPILILDEAASALDAHSEKKVQAALRQLRHGKTTIVVAHRLSSLRGADRIIVLAEGKLVEQGSPSELYAAQGLYWQLAKSQGL